LFLCLSKLLSVAAHTHWHGHRAGFHHYQPDVADASPDRTGSLEKTKLQLPTIINVPQAKICSSASDEFVKLPNRAAFGQTIWAGSRLRFPNIGHFC
jgi:hypothetical protein